MAAQDWDFIVWRRANDLLEQAERIHRNFLQVDAGARYRVSHGRTPSWQPPVNVVETDRKPVGNFGPRWSCRRPGRVRLEGRDLVIAGERPLPECCHDGELKLWEIPLGRFERRLRLMGGELPLSVGEISFQDGLLTIQIRKQS